MTKLKYVLVETEADWEENLYHAVVPIKAGYAEVDDPLTIEALLYRGFEIVEEPEVKATKKKAAATA